MGEPVLNRVVANTNSELPHENASFSNSEAKLTKLNESVEERPRLILAELAAVKMPVYAPTKNDLEIFRQSDRSQAQRNQIIDEMQLGECMPMETRFNDRALTDLSRGDLISFEIDSKRELYWYQKTTWSMANVGVVLKYENVEFKGFDENHDGTKWVILGEKSKQSPILNIYKVGISVSKDVWFSFKAATELGRLWPEKMNQEGLYEKYAKQLFAPKEFLEGRTLRLPLNILSKLHKKEGSIYKSLTLSY